jgi:hypothetical protein
MQPAPRHQCLIYSGPPSRHLPALASTMREKLRQNYRCLYLNSPAMVAGLRSYLAAAGVDVAQEVARNSLTLSSDQPHFANGSFDMDRLLKTLENLLKSALRDRYKGLWAVGDMTWELGMEKDPARLLEYEWRRITSTPKSAPTNRITTSISTQPSPDSTSQATTLRHRRRS